MEPYSVGDFRQGSPTSQWALARYLVGRAITESAGAAMSCVVAVLLALTVLSTWVLHWTVLSVLLVLLAVSVLLLRAALLGIVRRLTGWHRFGALEARMTALVHDSRRGVLRELRRIGLPGRTWTLPMLALRLASRRRRADTVERLRRFDTDRAVPSSQVDELHLVLRAVADEGAR